jgi:PPM family protein phosphatase
MLLDQLKISELQVHGCTGQHLGDRKDQQDRVAILTSQSAPRCVLGLVADGVGGRSGGALASENVLMAAQRLFDDFNPKESVETFFDNFVSEIHTILGLTHYTSRLDPHSTLAAVLVQPDQANWCHVGDSRLYFFRDGIEMARTEDHTLAQKLMAEGIARERAMLHPSANHLVNTLGGINTPKAAQGHVIGLQPGDRFLVCSDGLWGYFTSEELGQLTESTDLKDNSAKMITVARKRAKGNGDNCSLVLLGLDKKPEPA